MKQFNLSARLLSLILIATALLLAVLFFMSTIEIRDKSMQQCLAIYTEETCPHKDYIPLQSYIGFSISFFLGVLGVFLWFSGKKYSEELLEKEKRLQSALAFLQADERTICNLIKEAGNVIFQSDLVEKSKFNKVKVSRILDKLEGKGLIERRRKGMTNLVILKFQ